MLSDNYLPTSLQILLIRFRLGFTTPTFTTFCALVRGFIGCVGEHNVCGMLTGVHLFSCRMTVAGSCRLQDRSESASPTRTS